MGCLSLMLFLSPICTNSHLGGHWWIYALLSMIFPLHAFRINMSKMEWIIFQFLGLPIVFFLYLFFLKLELEALPPIMVAYIISGISFASSLPRWNFKKDALKLKETVDTSSNTELLKGVVYTYSQEEPEMIHFYEGDLLVAKVIKNSLFEFTIQTNNNQSFQFKKISNSSGEVNFITALKRKIRYIRTNYAIQLDESELTISESGLIQFPNGETASWDWKLGKLEHKKIKFTTSSGRKIQFQLYTNRGILCITEGGAIPDFKLAIIALACFFYSIFKHFQENT